MELNNSPTELEQLSDCILDHVRSIVPESSELNSTLPVESELVETEPYEDPLSYGLSDEDEFQNSDTEFFHLKLKLLCQEKE